jgi:Flp pilus assembly protein CpaB
MGRRRWLRRRWTGRSRIFLAASVGTAVLAGAVAHNYVAKASAAVAAVGSPQPVVVAAQPISRGQSITPAQVRIERIPKAFAPPGALREIRQAAGRVALTDLAPHEAVTQTRLARVRAGPVASLVPQGLRAFAVPTSLPPGSVEPGDRVDVLATFGAGGTGQPHTETVAEEVEVLLVLGPGGVGVGGSDQESGSGLQLDVGAAGAGSTVTLVLLVGPDQERDLAYARAFADVAVAVAAPP